MRRFAVRLAGCAVAVAIATPALLVTGGGLGVVAAGAAVTCPAGQPTGAAPGQGSSPTPGRPTTYPLGQCQLLLSTGAIPAGGTVTVTGSGFGAFARVSLSLGGTVVGSATADANGSFTASAVIPSSTPSGTYVMTASGGGQTLASQLVVTGNGSGSSAGAAPAVAVGTASSGSSGGGGSGSTGTSGTGSAGPSGGSATGSGSSGSTNGSGSTHAASPRHVAAPATVANHAQPGSPLAWAGLAALVLLALAGGLFFILRSRRSGTTVG